MTQYEFKMNYKEALVGTVEANNLDEAMGKARNGEIVGEFRVVDSPDGEVFDFKEI